ncbi:MAG: dTMP kinase [Archaeoglobi archaeon]|nr:dTMP kinase [Archaeoglobi archaeon]MDK2781442.1 dTMP kinase [Archaeoglobi archaeon]
MHGKFIVMEGIDGAGKGLQCRLLGERLAESGKKVFITEEPTKGRIGELIRGYLKEHDAPPELMALLFAADRKEHVEEILNLLKRGYTVISERYLFSSLAYQSSQGVDEGWIWEINRFAILPDIAILLDVSPEVSLKRLSESRERKEIFENEEFLRRVRGKYLEIFTREDERMRTIRRIIVHAERTPEEISEEIWMRIRDDGNGDD